MGEETARLRAEIDQTRRRLTRDVDLLAEKTSPSKIVERRVETTKRGISGIKDKVMGALPGSDDDEYGYDSGSGRRWGGAAAAAARRRGRRGARQRDDGVTSAAARAPCLDGPSDAGQRLRPSAWAVRRRPRW